MKENLIIFGPYCEFNGFIRCNAFIWKIKNRYKKIIVVVPPKMIDIMSEADGIISVPDEWLDDKKINFPEVYDYPDTIRGNLNTPSNPFFLKVLNHVKKNIDLSKFEIVYWCHDAVRNLSREPLFTDIFPVLGDVGKMIERDFNWVEEWLKAGKTLKPTLKNYENIKKKYGHLFNDQTYIFITRNFKSKQPMWNTFNWCTPLPIFLKLAAEKGLRIINVGFPPGHANIQSPNYIELGDALSEGDLASLFYLSKGVLLFCHAGGYVVHSCCNVDSFFFTIEGRGLNFNKAIKDGGGFSLSLSSHFPTYPYYQDKENYELVIKTLLEHKKQAKNIFVEEKPTIWIK